MGPVVDLARHDLVLVLERLWVLYMMPLLGGRCLVVQWQYVLRRGQILFSSLRSTNFDRTANHFTLLL